MLAVVPSHVTRADKYKHIKTTPLLVVLLGRLHYYYACSSKTILNTDNKKPQSRHNKRVRYMNVDTPGFHPQGRNLFFFSSGKSARLWNGITDWRGNEYDGKKNITLNSIPNSNPLYPSSRSAQAWSTNTLGKQCHMKAMKVRLTINVFRCIPLLGSKPDRKFTNLSCSGFS